MRFVSALLAFLLLTSCSRIHIIKEKDGLTPEEHLRLASIYESNGENELALREYEGASKGGRAAEAYFAMGNVYLKMKRFREAEASYRKAIKLDPSNGFFYNNLGWALMEAGEFDKAGEACKDAVKADPVREFIYLDTLGVIEMRQDKLKEAEESLNRAASLAPHTERDGLREIYRHLLEVYRKAGDDEKAAALEGRIKELN